MTDKTDQVLCHGLSYISVADGNSTADSRPEIGLRVWFGGDQQLLSGRSTASAIGASGGGFGNG